MYPLNLLMFLYVISNAWLKYKLSLYHILRMYPMNLCEIMWDSVMLVVVSVMYPLNLHVIMRDLVMPRWFSYVSFEPPRDYAGFGYARCLCCFGYARCLCCFGYVPIAGHMLCIISMILYYIKDITYDLI